MAHTVDWGHTPDSPPAGNKIGLRGPSRPRLEELPEDEIKRHREFESRKHGPLDQPTLEALVVACFLRGPNDEKLEKTMRVVREQEAEAIYSSEIRGEYFENRFLGAVFESLRDRFCVLGRKLVGIDEKGVDEIASGQDPNQVEMYKDELHECYATLLVRQIRAPVLIEQMTMRRNNRTVEKLVAKYRADRRDPKVGSKKALADFRIGVMQQLADQEGAAIQEHDWIEDYHDIVNRLRDMKRNPEKYMGYKCGIKVIDDKTKGFRPGHLTVFVGAHGGFKSTMMINVAYGLWKRGYNVLYASLEMEADLMEVKLWCRATQRVSFSKVYSGAMSEPGDWEERGKIEQQLAGNDLDKAERQRLSMVLDNIKNATTGLDERNKGEAEDTVLIQRFYEERKNTQNRLKIINAGQSSKVKPSQIGSWLKEWEGRFKPDVVVIDYLALMAPEQPYPDRRDQELGDICKYLRQMGKQMNFAVVTAAQFKRAAIERIRKSGFDKLEKAQVGTDDIAGSNMIGADADEAFFLFREDGGNKLRVLTVKARHGVTDTEKGEVLQVVPDTCTIAGDDFIEDTSIRTGQITIRDGMDAFGKIQEYLKREKTPDDEAENLSAIYSTGFFGDGDLDDGSYDKQIDQGKRAANDPGFDDQGEEDF